MQSQDVHVQSHLNIVHLTLQNPVSTSYVARLNTEKNRTFCRQFAFVSSVWFQNKEIFFTVNKRSAFNNGGGVCIQRVKG